MLKRRMDIARLYVTKGKENKALCKEEEPVLQPHSPFSVSASSSLTSYPCSFIVFIIVDTFCIAGGRSRDPVLISSSTSFAFSPCWFRESNTKEIYCVNCVVAAPRPFDPISISILNSCASSPCCFTVFSICDSLCDSSNALLYPVLNSISTFISGSGLPIIR